MRQFLTADITGGIKAPFAKPSLLNINSMTSELATSTAKAITNNTINNTDVHIMAGCVITGNPAVAGSVTYIAGTIYYAGNFYDVDAGTCIIAFGSVATWVLDTTNTTATFSDTIVRNFIQLNKFKLQGGVSGSGIADYDDVKLYSKTSRGSSSAINFVTPAPIATRSTPDDMFNKNGLLISFMFRVQLTFSAPITEYSYNFELADADLYPEVTDAYVGFNNCGFASADAGTGTTAISGFIRFEATTNRVYVSLFNATAQTAWDIVMGGSYRSLSAFSAY